MQQTRKPDPGGRKVTFSYSAGWPVWASGWSLRFEQNLSFRLAIGSFRQDSNNKLDIIQLQESSSGGHSSFRKLFSFDQPYPATKVLWSPDKVGTDLLASSSDFLRIYELSGGEGRLKAALDPKGVKQSDYSAPLTSLDWNEINPTRIATSSVDTTCAIWDIEVGRPITQLIAHDKEVHDVAFASRGTDVFASVGADGSCRMFDQRSLDHSTIIYETVDLSRLIKLAWNKKDPNYIALVQDDCATTFLIDIRLPSKTCLQLTDHKAPVNAITWAPYSANHLCSVSDDCQAIIWSNLVDPSKGAAPELSYTAKSPINNAQWSARHTNWISIAFGETLEILKVHPEEGHYGAN